MTEAKSTQPQLPPRPWDMPTDDKDVYELIASKAPEERRLIDNLFKKYADVAFQAIANCDEMRRCLKHAEAENESLKAQLAQWEQSYKSAVKGRQDFRSAMKLARKHQAVAEAERDKMLEVIREYRERLGRYNHGLDCLGAGACGVTDDRCPICIKADDLLSREPKEEK